MSEKVIGHADMVALSALMATGLLDAKVGGRQGALMMNRVSNAPPQIFDRQLWRQRRARARFCEAAFLRERAATDILDRLETATRHFDRAVIYGAPDFARAMASSSKIGWSAHADIAPKAAAQNLAPRPFVADEEYFPIAPGSLDLIVSFLTLHASNDLIGALSQMRAALKPDGLLIAALFGEETLKQLRTALYAAEASIGGGVAPRVAPFATVRDLGGALQRAGFALPVADLDRVFITYNSPYRLFGDLRAMGETSILKMEGIRPPLSREIALDTARRIHEAGGEVQFDVVYLTGWAPSATQPKPLKPGSATHSLAEADAKQENARGGAVKKS
ncbi:MAG: methyltransferase domain-containing protein [Pseudomonadota bacterium]